MNNNNSGSNTIAKNTLYLYTRLLFTIFISFYTSRIVLQALGVEDFGILNVVGSIIAMFSFMNAGMIQASQRFMSYEIGKKDSNGLKDVFSTSLLIHILIALVVFVAVEAIGVWFLNAKMNIAEERMTAANFVLQCSLISFLISVISVPFASAIIAHEKMGVYAIVTLLDAILKLAIAFLAKVSSGDRLILYSVLLIIIPLIEILIYSIYCKKNFEEVSLKVRYNQKYFRRILGFAGWSFVGNLGFIGRNAGVNVVINLLCGVAVNAARGVAYQVSSQIMSFASNFQMAIVPQITKRYASQDYKSMMSLVVRGSKFSFILLYLISLPFCLRSDYVLSLWLGNVPEFTREFVILALIVSLIDGMAIPLGKAIDATGQIKWFQISVSAVMLLDIPLSWLILQLGVEPYIVVFSSIIVSLVALVIRIVIVKKRFSVFSVWSYILNVFIRCSVAAVISFLLCVFIDKSFYENFMGLLIVCIVTIVINLLVFSLIALSADERKYYGQLILSKLHLK